MNELTKEEKVKFCKESAEQFGEPDLDWDEMNDEQLNKCVAWFDYLWEK